MRVYIYNLLDFPSSITICLDNTTPLFELINDVQSGFKNKNLTLLYDFSGRKIKTLINEPHNSLYFAYYESENLPNEFHTKIMIAQNERIFILNQHDVTLEIIKSGLIAYVIFLTTWFNSEGRLKDPWLLCIFFIIACYRSPKNYIKNTLEYNIHRIIKTDKKLIFAIAIWLISYLVLNNILNIQSNGTSPSLILFTVSMCLVYLLPDLINQICVFIKERKYQNPKKYIKSLAFLCVLSLITIFLMYIDAYFTAFVRLMTFKGRCTTLLNNESNDIDYALDIMKPYTHLYELINRFDILNGTLRFADGLGEVPKIMPSIIALTIFTQLMTPKRYEYIRIMFFKSVFSVVLGGLFSASLKIIFHRYRPMAYGEAFKFSGPGMYAVDHTAFSKMDLSFPCGHATIVFGLAYVYYNGLMLFLKANRPKYVFPNGLKIFLIFLFFSMPTFTGLSRVAECMHWGADVFFGSCLGILVGSLCVNDNFGIKSNIYEENENLSLEVINKDTNFNVYEKKD